MQEGVDAFSTITTTSSRHLSTTTTTTLCSSTNEENDDKPKPSGYPYQLENDFQMFLSQCALQSMLFLLEQVRDRQTALWIEGFIQPVLRRKEHDNSQDITLDNMAQAEDIQAARHTVEEVKLLKYHGLGIFDIDRFPTWQFFFEKLLEEDAITYIIENDNPHVPDYELEINPASLCSRIISVREQIAKEFVRDLDVIADLGGQTMETYWESLKQKNEKQEGGDFNAKTANLIFMESFDMEEYVPSPLRKGNFDLLVNLATQESIHRVLNKYHHQLKNNDGDQRFETSDLASLLYLDGFYSKRKGTHFAGSQWYGRADDLLKELLMTPPSTVQVPGKEEVHLVDPIRIVEMILEEREKVAMEWGDIAYEIPTYHTDIKRIQLNKLMGGPKTIAEENVFE
jgi:hypothetical protein